MGSVLSAQKISAALDKAKNICIVEETVEIAGVQLVVRNLRPSDYENITKATVDATNEAEYLYAWQKAHICHALVEVNGVDFRGVDFVEVEEIDSKGQKKTVKLETKSYLRDHLVSTWSKEACYTVYRKIGDAISRAESASSQNIKFLVAEETPEEKYRRIVGELRDFEDEIPAAIVNTILDENGLMRKSTAAEVKAAMERDSKDGWEAVQKKKQEAEAAPVVAPPPPPVEPCGESIADPMQRGVRIPCEQQFGHAGDHMGRGLIWERVVAAPRPTPPVGTPETFEKRTPLSQMVVDVPSPQAAQRETVPAARPVSARSREYAALEEEADADRALPEGVDLPKEIPTLYKKQDRIDPKEATKAIGGAPSVGLNPKFRPR